MLSKLPLLRSYDILYNPGVYADGLYLLLFKREGDALVNANDFFVLQFTYLMGQYHGNRRMIAIWESPNPRGAKIYSTRGFTHPDNYL